MGWYSMRVRCVTCHCQWDCIVPSEEKDELVLCACCEEYGGRRMLAAPVVLKASHPDGHKRFTKLRQEATLDAALSTARDQGDTKGMLQIGREKAKLATTKKEKTE